MTGIALIVLPKSSDIGYVVVACFAVELGDTHKPEAIAQSNICFRSFLPSLTLWLTFFAFSDAQGVGTNDDFEHLEGIFNGEGRLNFRAEGIFESGAGTGSRNFNFQVLGNTVPVPEPSSLVVLSLLCAGLLGKRRRHVANTSVGL